MAGARPASIRIFLAEGEPDGLRLVEMSNWTGLLLVSSRASLSTLRAREEVQGPGVYLLMGAAVDGDRPALYVGEADDVARRLADHVRKDEDFWSRVVVVTTKYTNFNKASARWLEARLIGLASKAARVDLKNGNAGSPVRLSEADAADMDAFLADVLMVLPVLGVSAFQDRLPRPSPITLSSSCVVPSVPLSDLMNRPDFLCSQEPAAVLTAHRRVMPPCSQLANGSSKTERLSSSMARSC